MLVDENSVRWPTSGIDRADRVIAEAAYDIRLYYYRQLRLLREIPYLALEADGRGGWDDNLSRAYRQCIYPLHESHGKYDLFVDLRRGDLITSFGVRDIPLIRAESLFVFETIAHKPFSPVLFIERLNEQIKGAYHNRPDEVKAALERKAVYKKKLDIMINEIPLDNVISQLIGGGYPVQ